MMTMMAQMNAVAAATAAMAMGSMDSTANQMALAQAMYPANYGPLSIDTGMNRSLLELHPALSSLHPTHGVPLYNHDQQDHSLQLSSANPQQGLTQMQGRKLDIGAGSDAEDEESYSSANADEDSRMQTANNSQSKLPQWGNLKMGKKICRVCGDKALGYNFNVVSCESCKAFFRRNALKKKEFRCPFNEKCEVTAVSRRFCQKCRLRKCFEVGMKKEWIMSEEARMQKRARIEENRRKRTTSTKDMELGMFAEENQVSSTSDSDAPPPAKKAPSIPPLTQTHELNKFTNLGFSPQQNCQTPPMFGVGSAFSPPDSNQSSKNLSPAQPRIVEAATLGNTQKIAAPVDLQHNGKMSAVQSGVESMGTQSAMLPTVASGIASTFSPASSQYFQPQTLSSSPSKPIPVAPVAPTQAAFTVIPGFPQGSPYGLGSGSTTPFSPEKRDGDDSITIPKSVLISLINQCHTTPYEGVAKPSPPPPIVARAHRFAIEGCANDDLQCICRCACGARAANARIGPRTVDRGVGPDSEGETTTETAKNDHEKEEKRESPCVRKISDKWVAVDVNSLTWDSPLELCKRVRYNGVLTPLEDWKLQELYAANRIMTDPPDLQEESNLRQIQQARQQNGRADSCPSTVYLADVCVRRIIKMCKRISPFGSLCQDDQIALLKGGCTELMLLRGVMTFIPEKDSWRAVGCKDTFLSLDVLKGVKGNVYEEHRRFLHSFREEWRRSDAIMLTLAAITLFNPRRPNVAHPQAIQMEQESYLELLQRYLDILYGTGTLASSEAFRELILRVEAVGRLNDYAATIFLEVNPRDVEPLLIEIFDLK